MSDERIELLKEMTIAHAMSHEPFCDAGYWKDEFERLCRLALSAIEPEPIPQSVDKKAFLELSMSVVPWGAHLPLSRDEALLYMNNVWIALKQHCNITWKWEA
jgi:hypothetical protein